MKSKLPVPTANDINEAHRLARASAETAVGHAIRCGQMLLAKKDAIDHGDFQSWIEENCSFGWSAAKRYISAAKQNATGVAFDSLRHYFPSGRKSSAAPASQKATAVAFCDAPAAAPVGFVPPTAPSAALPGKPKREPEAVPISAIEPDFVEGTPEGYEPDDDEEYQERIERVMMADDKLAAMREELKKQQIEIAQFKRSRDHYMTAQGEAVRQLKKALARVARLEKERVAA